MVDGFNQADGQGHRLDPLGLGGLFVQWDWEVQPDDEEPFGLTRDEVRRAENAAARARIELREIDESLANLERIASLGMHSMDEEILNIMQKKLD